MDEQLEAICRVAQIHEVIQQLPDGYETIIGERGIIYPVVNASDCG